MEKKVFLVTYAGPCREACAGTGLFPSVKIAQLALETGWGSSIKTAANNCFGMKAGPKWTGKVISNTTKEVINGVKQTYAGTGKIYNSWNEAKTSGAHEYTLFRAYDSVAASIKDHSQLLLTADRYTAARNASTPQEQCDLIQAAGYATDLSYAKTLKSIIQSNHLEQNDS